MTICRGFDPAAGWLVFYTDRESEKGAALAKHPWAACVFHWDAFERQVRVEGPITLTPDADSDAYWNSRPPDARIVASASSQSRPLKVRADLLARIAELTKQSAGGPIPRPPRWGGTVCGRSASSSGWVSRRACTTARAGLARSRRWPAGSRAARGRGRD